jgi:hypothetical protein
MKTTPFRNALLWVLFFFVALAAYAGPKLLTTDPLTGPPLYPPPDSRLRLGNDPIQLPESNVCKSKTQADLHSVYDSKVDATLAWYASRLSGFKKTHAYAADRSQDTFYSSDGTLIVSVTGSVGKDGEDTDTYSVLYARFTTGLSEKTILGMNQQTIVCSDRSGNRSNRMFEWSKIRN